MCLQMVVCSSAYICGGQRTTLQLIKAVYFLFLLPQCIPSLVGCDLLYNLLSLPCISPQQCQDCCMILHLQCFLFLIWYLLILSYVYMSCLHIYIWMVSMPAAHRGQNEGIGSPRAGIRDSWQSRSSARTTCAHNH